MNVIKWIGYFLLLGLFIWFVFFRNFNPFAAKTNEIVSTTTQEILDESATENAATDDAFVDENTENIIAEEELPEASKPPKETPKTNETSQDNSINLNQRYLIVVGSFGSKANADKMLKRVLKDGNQGQITMKGNLHRVVTGSTDDLANAKNLRDHFTHIYKETAFILEN